MSSTSMYSSKPESASRNSVHDLVPQLTDLVLLLLLVLLPPFPMPVSSRAVGRNFEEISNLCPLFAGWIPLEPIGLERIVFDRHRALDRPLQRACLSRT